VSRFGVTHGQDLKGLLFAHSFPSFMLFTSCTNTRRAIEPSPLLIASWLPYWLIIHTTTRHHDYPVELGDGLIAGCSWCTIPGEPAFLCVVVDVFGVCG
jgi:hypothetical protein